MFSLEGEVLFSTVLNRLIFYFFVVFVVFVLVVVVVLLGVADDVDFVVVRVVPLPVRVVVVVVREPPPVVDGLGIREVDEVALDATVDLAVLARDVAIFGVGTRLVLVVVRLVVVFVVVDVPEAPGLPSSVWTVVVFLVFEVGVAGLGDARPSRLPAFFKSPLRLDPDFLRGPKAGGDRLSLSSAPEPSRDIPGLLIRNAPTAFPERSGDTPTWWMSKFVRPSAEIPRKG